MMLTFWDTVRGAELADTIIRYLPKVCEDLEKIRNDLEKDKNENEKD